MLIETGSSFSIKVKKNIKKHLVKNKLKGILRKFSYVKIKYIFLLFNARQLNGQIT